MNKTEKAVKKFTEGDIIGAIGIMRTFKMGFSKEEQRIMQIAYEGQNNGSFYASIGIDTGEYFRGAVEIIKKKYSV